jgi:hypothetical protein
MAGLPGTDGNPNPPPAAALVAAPIVNMNNYPIGNYVDLFDDLGTKLAIPIAANQPVAFANLAAAKDKFITVFDEPARTTLATDSTRLLNSVRIVNPSDRDIARSVLPLLTVAPTTELAKSIFRASFLLTPWQFNCGLRYGDLLLHAYVAFSTLRTEHHKRDALALTKAKHCGEKSKAWVKLRIRWTRKFIAFMIYSIFRGPYWLPGNATAIVNLISADNPVYHFVVVPILKMAKGFFPNSFAHGSILSADLVDFVNNQKRMAGKGLYSNKFLKRIDDGPDAPRHDGVFLTYLFYWHYRTLNNVNQTFDTSNGDPVVIPEFKVTPEEARGANMGFQIAPIWMNPRKKLKFVVWFPAVAEVQAQAPVGGYNGDDLDDDASAQDADEY